MTYGLVEPESQFVESSQDATESPARFYVNRVDRESDLDSEPVARLTGNRVLLFRENIDLTQLPSGLYARDLYAHGSRLYKVIAVGPGTWTRHYNRRNKFKWLWVEPDVKIGDIVVSNHWTDAAAQPAWFQPQNLDDSGGSGRVIVDARFILVKFTPK